MKKLLWIVGVIVVLFIVLSAGLTIFVKSYFTGDRLKAMLIPKLEAATGRNVSIGEMDISIFKGVIVKNIGIKEREGNKDFISAKEFILSYQLLPLLKKQLVISKLELDAPRLSVIRDKNGVYNFNDILEKRRSEQQKKKEPEEKGIPLAVVADSIRVRDAMLAFTDTQKKLPDVTAEIPAIELKASVGMMPEEIALTGHIDLRSVKAVLNRIPTDTSGRIDVTNKDIAIALTTMLGKDSIKTSGSIANYRTTTPDVRINLSSKQLDLDKLMPPPSVSRHPREAKGFSPIYYVRYDRKQEITASGRVTIDALRYSGYDIRNLLIGYRYRNGAVVLSPLQMNLAGGTAVNAAGTVKGAMGFRYDPESTAAAEAIKGTLTGKAVVDLNKIQVRSSRIMEAISFFTGIDELRQPQFDNGRFTFTIRNQKTFIDGLLNSRFIVISPSGTVGFDKRLDMLADLKLAPALSSRLSRMKKITGYFKNNEGWTVIPLKISGTTDKPSVGMNTAALGKQLQKGVQGEIERRLFEKLQPKGQGAQEEKKGGSPEDILKGLFGK